MKSIQGVLGFVALLSLSACAHGFADMAVNDNAQNHANRLGRFPDKSETSQPQLTASNDTVQCAK